MSRRLLLPRRRGILRYSELWLDGQELLYVHSSRFSDRYARYRLRDIQALVLTELPLWNVWRAVWVGGLLFFTIILLALPPHYWKLSALLPGLFLAIAILRLSHGPRCRVVLHTAVSTVRLEPISTMARARAVMPVLRGLIEETQGRLSGDGLTVTEMPHVEPPVERTLNTPLLLYVLFGAMVVHALVLAVLYFANRMADGLSISASLLFCELFLSALAALRWRTIGVVLTGVAGLIFVLSLIDSGVLAYSFADSVGGIIGAAGRRETLRPEDLKWLWMKEQTVARAAWHALAGVAGWVLLLIRREETA
ncbi:MAG TPA: hypothetical protein VFQ91_06720 [Bryobacteraceae bacterium]|nr:hypothetical protein [Bryobacteraceae bacterium]